MIQTNTLPRNIFIAFNSSQEDEVDCDVQTSNHTHSSVCLKYFYLILKLFPSLTCQNYIYIFLNRHYIFFKPAFQIFFKSLKFFLKRHLKFVLNIHYSNYFCLVTTFFRMLIIRVSNDC